MNRGRKYYFLTIADTLNISRAAEKLHVSQPSLTQYLNRLEEELDTKLVDRRFTPLRLTESGRIYYDYLTKSEALDAELQDLLTTERQGKQRRLTIGIPAQKTHDITKIVMPGFIEKHPDINITVWEGTSSTVRDRIVDGRLEIGFAHTLTVDDDECNIIPLTREKIAVVCNKDNPVVKGRKSSPREFAPVEPDLLNDLLFFQMPQEYFLFTVEDAEMKKYGINPKHRMIMSNLHAILGCLVDNPMSFAFIPDYLFKASYPMSIESQLAFLKLGEDEFIWDFSMLKRRGRVLSKNAQMFWDTVLRYMLE